ncbi:MAG: DUF1080 domain-containing protein [Mariniblastus sp.]|nr:DUF1080 domain-containing protein [Mariniblastus sp.]
MFHRLVILLILLVPVNVEAQEATPSGDGWVLLFNTKDLTGWSQKNGTADYKVIDGTVKGTTSEGSPNSFLCTDRDFGDFELMFETKVDNGLNSGVQIRSQSKTEFKKGRVHGPQVEIEMAPGESGYIYSEGTGRGWLSQKRDKKDTFKNGQWNQYRVLAKGARIQTWVNGIAVADMTDEDSSRKGFIGLQVHGIPKNKGPFSVQWRNIKIRELKD